VKSPKNPGNEFLYLSTEDVKPLLGSEPFFGQSENAAELVTDELANLPHSPVQAARHSGAPIVFLGLHEPADSALALPSTEFTDASSAVKNLDGIPYFSLDVAELDKSEEELKTLLEGPLSKDGRTFSWEEPRSLTATFDGFTAAVFANARSMVDWNLRNKVGIPTPSIISERKNSL